MSVAEVAAAEQSTDVIPPPKQSASEKLLAALTLIRLALVGTWRHYTPGPPAPTWPLFLSVVTYLIRTNATLASQKRTGDPARAPESRAHLVGLAQVKTALDKFVVNNDNLEDAVVKEVDLPVRQRPLGGLLRDLAAQETGQRQLKAEWTVHNSLLASSGAEYREPRHQVVLYLHGGAHVRLSVRTHRRTVAAISREFRCRALSLDYRLSPAVVFPASTLDSVSAYFYLTEDLGIAAKDIVVAGDSAGAGLCLSLIQYLRDADLPQVGAAYLLSPWCDLTTSFESWNRNGDYDYIKIDNEEDPMHPPRLYLSSVYPRTATADAEYEQLKASAYVSQAVAPLAALADLPPILVQTGGLETLFDENVVLVRRLREAGNEAVTHQIWTDGVHVFQALQADRSGASALREAGKWYARLLSNPADRDLHDRAVPEKDSGASAWTAEVDRLVEEEKRARIARSGPIRRAKGEPAGSHRSRRHRWEYVRTVERAQPDPIRCKADCRNDAARRACDEANAVTGERAEAEVFRPVRV